MTEDVNWTRRTVTICSRHTEALKSAVRLLSTASLGFYGYIRFIIADTQTLFGFCALLGSYGIIF
jgi:hypothetical protein